MLLLLSFILFYLALQLFVNVDVAFAVFLKCSVLCIPVTRIGLVQDPTLNNILFFYEIILPPNLAISITPALGLASCDIMLCPCIDIKPSKWALAILFLRQLLFHVCCNLTSTCLPIFIAPITFVF